MNTMKMLRSHCDLPTPDTHWVWGNYDYVVVDHLYSEIETQQIYVCSTLTDGTHPGNTRLDDWFEHAVLDESEIPL